MLSAFKKHIEEHFPELRERGNTFLLALSGGIDSRVLGDLLYKIGVNFAVCHCNFNLRGKESERDVAFAETLAKDWTVVFHLENFDTGAFAEEHKISTQMAARELRYSAFAELCEKYGYAAAISAHNLNDQAETVIHNFARGTALAGLVGMRSKKPELLRPLLVFSRRQIEQYARKNKLQWVEDSSNAQSKYKRNFIRHKIIPGLEEVNTQFLESFRENNLYLWNTKTLFDSLVKEKSALFCAEKDGSLHINIARLKKEKHYEMLLFELLKNYGFISQLADVLNILDAQSGKRVLGEKYTALKNRSELIVSEIQKTDRLQALIYKETESLNEPLHIKIERVKYSRQELKQENSECFCESKLNFPLRLRQWQSGDYIIPLGRTGRQKVSKILKDNKVSLIEKNKTFVLENGDGRIIWLVGHKISEEFKAEADYPALLKFLLI